MNQYQTLGPRILALIVDFIVFIPLMAVYIWLPLSEVSIPVQFTILVSGSVITLSYNILLHWKYGQTLGKMFAKVKVVNVELEGAISFRQALLRDIIYIVIEVFEFSFMAITMASEAAEQADLLGGSSAFYFIYVWLVIDIIVCIKSKKNRALHDFIAGTVVVRLDVRAENEPGKKLQPPGPEEYADALT